MYHSRIIQGLFLTVSVTSGYVIFSNNPPFSPVRGILIGLVAGILAIVLEQILRMYTLGQSLGGILGAVSGLLIGNSVKTVIERSFFIDDGILPSFLFNFIFGYMGLVLGVHAGKWLSAVGIPRLFSADTAGGFKKILDTSVIIDGRIADLCETGFLEGTFVVPQFILRELQHIADSQDPLKRVRGRRGMDVLHRIQKMSGVEVEIVDNDFSKIHDVDSKIVALARGVHAKIITNDLNLSKIAELQGIAVLNINELCNALRPVVLPGESMNVFVLKEGKEYNQGVAYLDDGTMIVVEDAKRCIGRNVEVSVTSVLQTTAGRMIFAKVKENGVSTLVVNR